MGLWGYLFPVACGREWERAGVGGGEEESRRQSECETEEGVDDPGGCAGHFRVCGRVRCRLPVGFRPWVGVDEGPFSGLSGRPTVAGRQLAPMGWVHPLRVA